MSFYIVSFIALPGDTWKTPLLICQCKGTITTQLLFLLLYYIIFKYQHWTFLPAFAEQLTCFIYVIIAFAAIDLQIIYGSVA